MDGGILQSRPFLDLCIADLSHIARYQRLCGFAKLNADDAAVNCFFLPWYSFAMHTGYLVLT